MSADWLTMCLVLPGSLFTAWGTPFPEQGTWVAHTLYGIGEKGLEFRLGEIFGLSLRKF